MKTSKFYFSLALLSLSILISSCSGDDLPEIPPVAPTANFSASVDIAIAGNAVQLTDLSSGDIDTYSWTFEGAATSTSTEKNPSVTFNEKGVFKIKLTVTGPGGSDTTEIELLGIEACALYDCEKFLVEETKDIIYGIDDDRHKMNIFEPVGDERTSKPAIVIMGGGGFNGSNLDNIKSIAERLSSYGFLVATASYRKDAGLGGTANLMRGMVDTKAAVRFLRTKAADYNIDVNKIFNGGWSTGAQIALIHTYWQESDVPAPVRSNLIPALISSWEGSQGNSGVSSDVSGSICLGGSFFGQAEAWEDDLWIAGTEAPAYLVHGDEDEETYYKTKDIGGGFWEYGSFTIHERLKTVSNSSELYIIEGGNHDSAKLEANIDKYLPELVMFITSIVE